MTGDELAGVVDLDHLPVGQDFDPFARQPVGHRVAVGFEGDEAVLGDVAHGPLLEDIGGTALHGEEKVLFLEEHLGGPAVRRAVDALVGDVDDPLEKLDIEVVETLELFAPEEALHVLDARLDLCPWSGAGTAGEG